MERKKEKRNEVDTVTITEVSNAEKTQAAMKDGQQSLKKEFLNARSGQPSPVPQDEMKLGVKNVH